MKDAAAEGYQLLYVDETMFSYSQTLPRTWQKKRTNLELKYSADFQTPVAVTMAVSAEMGVVAYQLDV